VEASSTGDCNVQQGSCPTGRLSDCHACVVPVLWPYRAVVYCLACGPVSLAWQRRPQRRQLPLHGLAWRQHLGVRGLPLVEGPYRRRHRPPH
jgi:hypothetical protein